MDGRIPHLLIARIASAVIALGSIPAIALGHSVDTESQIVVLNPIDAVRGSPAGGWFSIFIVCALGAFGLALWWRKSGLKHGFVFDLISKFFPKTFVRRAVGNGAIEILDRTAMSKGQSLTLVRVGDRVVLLGQSAQGFQRLAEFSADASQVNEAGVSQSSHSGASIQSHRRVG